MRIWILKLGFKELRNSYVYILPNTANQKQRQSWKQEIKTCFYKFWCCCCFQQQNQKLWVKKKIMAEKWLFNHDFCPLLLFQWMRQFWKSDPCYEKDHGVNGSICSFIVYLSEVSLQHYKFLHFMIIKLSVDCNFVRFTNLFKTTDLI